MQKGKVHIGMQSAVRWAARMIGVVFAGLFLFFFISEGGLGEFIYLNGAEKLRLTFLPLLFTIGLVTAWKRERLGGVLMILGIIGFNLVRVTAEGGFDGRFEFWPMLIPGIAFVLLARLHSQKSA